MRSRIRGLNEIGINSDLSQRLKFMMEDQDKYFLDR